MALCTGNAAISIGTGFGPAAVVVAWTLPGDPNIDRQQRQRRSRPPGEISGSDSNIACVFASENGTALNNASVL